MSTENKSPRKRDQALNDATSRQLGEAPSDIPEFYTENQETKNSRSKAARKMSRKVDLLSNIGW